MQNLIDNRRNEELFKSYLIRVFIISIVVCLIHLIYSNDRRMLVKLTHIPEHLVIGIDNSYESILFKVLFSTPPNKIGLVILCANWLFTVNWILRLQLISLFLNPFVLLLRLFRNVCAHMKVTFTKFCI